MSSPSSSISQAPLMEVSTKRHSIYIEKEAAKKSKPETTKVAENEVDVKQKVETTKAAENEVDEKQQVESTKAEKQVAEKQNAESTEDEKAIAAEMHEIDSTDEDEVDSIDYDADHDAYEARLFSIPSPDWEETFFASFSSTDGEEGEALTCPSASSVDTSEDSDDEVSSEALASHEKEKLEADIDRAVATDERRRKKMRAETKRKNSS